MLVLARHYALGVVQAFSAVANVIAASVGIFLDQIQQTSTIHGVWRCEFLVGALALVIFKKTEGTRAVVAHARRKSAHELLCGSFFRRVVDRIRRLAGLTKPPISSIFYLA